jgi:ABC-type lipoprotein release transport system permease subunit
MASVRRRRREFALLKTLGFTQRQLAATVAWQSSVPAIVGLIFGVRFPPNRGGLPMLPPL